MGQSSHNPLTSGRRAESLLREFLFIFFLVLLLLALLCLFASVSADFCCSVGHSWVFFCLLLFSVCCLLRESFAVLEQCYSTAFVPRTLRSLIFFATLKGLCFTYFSRLSLLPILFC